MPGSSGAATVEVMPRHAPSPPAAPPLASPGETPPIPTNTPAIHIEGLDHRYPGGEIALREVSLTLQPGERVALVGPNGAGKTTLLAYAAAALPSDRVSIFGRRATKRHLPSLRGRVGLVFQQPDDQLFMPTVADDVAFGPLNQRLPRQQVEERVAEALDAVGLPPPQFAARPPHTLSGGEKRLAALATVLSMQPDVLALDEPTNDLDPRARQALLKVLGRLSAALLVATHDLEFVLALCDRAVLLDAGRVVADGPAREILSDPHLMDSHGLEVPLSLRLALPE